MTGASGTPSDTDGAMRAAVAAMATEFRRQADPGMTWFSAGACRQTPTGAGLLASSSAEELVGLAIGALREATRLRFETRVGPDGWLSERDVVDRHMAQDLAGCVLRRKLPWTDRQLAELLDALAGNAYNGSRNHLMVGYDPVKPVVTTLERHCQGQPAPRALHERLRTIADLLQPEYAEDARVRQRVLALLSDSVADDPLPASEDPWTAALLAARSGTDQTELADRVLAIARTATSSRPGKRFSGERDRLIAEHGSALVAELASAMIAAGCKPRATRDTGPVPAHIGDVLRGLAWIAAAGGGEGAARALGDLALCGWTKVPSHGPACSKAANVALAALGELPEGAGQLGRVRAQLKQPAARRAADAAIDRAAERLGIRRDQFEERVVPDFGLGPDGTRSVAVGEHVATLVLSSGLNCELRFAAPSGKPLKAPPAAVRRDHSEQLAALRQTAKDVKLMATAQRLRLERLLLVTRTWEQAEWRAHYLDHGVVGTLAKRLIWNLELPSGPRSVLFEETAGELVDVDGEAVEPGEARVSLWHPVDADPAEVRAWRRFLEEREIRQPFKQAHREIYLLTEAERTTATYSNRFAAHVLRQHQMAALARARGWTYALQGAWDTPDEHAELRLTEHRLRVAFWTQRPLDTEDFNDAGVFNHVLTDQVRFHTLDDEDTPSWRRDPTADTLALDTIPPRAFSEAMRDVDLFVGISSIGNDPTWADRGEQVEDRYRVNDQYQGYWSAYAFGELGEAATVRHDLLERLLPKLAIADRARLDGRFLRIHGTLREYKIHLGSGNILMEPNDAYLCIVPGRDPDTPRNVFLPFDGDPVLAIVLSKAFLLARDHEITDPTITAQIRG